MRSEERLLAMELELRELRRELSRLRVESPSAISAREIRMARTSLTPAGTYPTNGNTFPIVFVDCSYNKVMGTNPLSCGDRQGIAKAVVYNIRGRQIPVNTLVAVWEDHGCYFTDFCCTSSTGLGTPVVSDGFQSISWFRARTGELVMQPSNPTLPQVQDGFYCGHDLTIIGAGGPEPDVDTTSVGSFPILANPGQTITSAILRLYTYEVSSGGETILPSVKFRARTDFGIDIFPFNPPIAVYETWPVGPEITQQIDGDNSFDVTTEVQSLINDAAFVRRAHFNFIIREQSPAANGVRNFGNEALGIGFWIDGTSQPQVGNVRHELIIT